MGFLNTIGSYIRSWWNNMFSKETIEKALGVQLVISPEMQKTQEIWRQLFYSKAPWHVAGTKSLETASSLCTEVARAVTIEFDSTVTGSPRANYLNKQYQRVVDDLRKIVEKLCYNGTIILKPYIKNNQLYVTVVENNCYYPVEYNELGELTSAVFQQRLARNKKYYTLLEKAKFEVVKSDETEDGTQVNYTVENTAWEATNDESLGKEIPLTNVPEWSKLAKNITFKNVKRAWFTVINMPALNHIEQGSTAGMAIFSKSVGLIKDLDEQYARTKWEFEGGELAIDAPLDLFKRDAAGNAILPQGRKRLYRTYDSKSVDDKFNIKVFSPPFRNQPLNEEQDEIARKIEFRSGVSYGTLSKVTYSEKTATEIRAGKQRFYTTVTDIQKAIQRAMEELVEIMTDIADRYELAPQGEYEMGFNWDDSILADRPLEFQEKMTLVDAGLLPGYKFLAWYLGIPDDDAKELIAENQAFEDNVENNPNAVVNNQQSNNQAASQIDNKGGNE